MSSPLDARIRALVAEEGAKHFLTREEMEKAGGTADFEAPPHPVAELEQRLDALIARVDELAKTSTDRAKRAPRKTAEPSE